LKCNKAVRLDKFGTSFHRLLEYFGAKCMEEAAKNDYSVEKVSKTCPLAEGLDMDQNNNDTSIANLE